MNYLACVVGCVFLALAPQLGNASDPPAVRWTATKPNIKKPNAGYSQAEGVEHIEVFRGTPKLGMYNHHPNLLHHGGRFLLVFSNHSIGEEGGGSRTLLVTSNDGQAWSAPVDAFPALGPNTHPEKPVGRTVLPAAWITLDDEAYLIGLVAENIGFADMAQSEIMQERSPQAPSRVRRHVARVARRVSADGAMGPTFCIDRSFDAVDGFACYPGPDDPRFTAVAERLRQQLTDPLQWSQFGAGVGHEPIPASDGEYLSEECSTYRRPDGTLVRLYRGRGQHLHHLYATLLHPGTDTWTEPEPTNIPNAPSRFWMGTLPDGRTYLVGNQSPEAQRRTLTVATTRDGVRFDKVWAIRHGAGKPRQAGPGKGGLWGYPSCQVVGDSLWVAYSIFKEDIAITRVPLSSLGVSTAAVQPDVLFIAVDDLNDWTGALGGHPQAQTPHIDALMNRGVLFTNAHCAAPACNPSRAALPHSDAEWSPYKQPASPTPGALHPDARRSVAPLQ